MTVMDKTVFFVCSMLSTAMGWSFMKLLITADTQYAISALILLWAVIYIAATYPKHRKDYT
jgi:hypothetical protein